MNDKILVKLETDWADEFMVQSIWLTTKSEFENFLDVLSKKDVNEEVKVYYGTNQFIDFTSVDDIIDSLSVTSISEDYYNTIVDLLGSSFGIINIEHLPKWYKDLSDERKSEI